jgi:membrane fusion protein (multidrug efflux system)
MSSTLKQFLHKPKLVIPIAVVAVIGIIALITMAIKSNDDVKAGPGPLDVEVVQVKQDDVPIYSEWIGTTEGLVNADIKAQVTGYLLRQDYQEGSFVRKGQLLFEIDPRPLQAVSDQASGQLAQFEGQLAQSNSQVVQAEAQLAQANSQLLQSQAQLARAQANQVKTQLDVNKYAPLAEQKAVTQQDYDNAVQANVVSKAEVEAARAGVESARARLRAANAQIGTAKAATQTAKGQVENAKGAVRSAQLNVEFTRIVSPIDGIVGRAQAQVGDLVQPNNSNSPPLTTVSTVDPIEVYFTISEQQYLAFTKLNLIEARKGGSVAQIELELILADGTTYPQKGSFYYADRQVDQKTGAIRIAGLFPNPGNILRPGQFARVRAITAMKNSALLVPQRAVTQLQGGYQVAVVGNDNKVEIRMIKLGDHTGPMWIVEDGLKAGETIVVEGIQRVRSGVLVNPKPYTKKD